jgi:CRISPR-associated protein Csm4
MKSLCVTLQPVTAFVTPLHGDTLFGQLCWALRNRLGDAWLGKALAGYGQGEPFLVVSDAFPAGYWPRPHLPPWPDEVRDKVAKNRVWLSRREWKRPLREWLSRCCDDQTAFASGTAPSAAQQKGSKEWKNGPCPATICHRPQPHNSINRLTGTTGEGGFAPYAVEQTWYPPEGRLEVWLLHDERLQRGQLWQALQDVGQSGFGKKASSGRGHFALQGEAQEETLPCQNGSNAWLSLGFCLPHGGGFAAQRSFYQVFTRFGRHGDLAAVTGHPFKKPVLLTRSGGLFTPEKFTKRQWIGQGIGGDGRLSQVIPETVQQGYAPVVGLQVDWESFNHG